MFRLNDTWNGEVSVSQEGFKVVMQSIGIDLTEQQLDVPFLLFHISYTKVLKRILDIRGDGFFDFEQFLIGVRVKIH